MQKLFYYQHFRHMLRLTSVIPNHSAIKNIIFDFGGVICGLDISKTEQKFREFGPSRPAASDSAVSQSQRFQTLVEDLETGAISPEKFRQEIRDNYVIPPSDDTIDETWNAMLLNIPEKRIRLLENLRSHFRIFLLSNSNQIHYKKYLRDFQLQTGYSDFNDLFEKAYFSFQVGLKKPGKEIFEFVLSKSGLYPSESIFIDDTPENVEAAMSIGLNGFYLHTGTEINDLFIETD